MKAFGAKLVTLSNSSGRLLNVDYIDTNYAINRGLCLLTRLVTSNKIKATLASLISDGKGSSIYQNIKSIAFYNCVKGAAYNFNIKQYATDLHSAMAAMNMAILQ